MQGGNCGLLSVVVPVFRGQLALPELVRQLEHERARPSRNFTALEVIFVCDCSPDGSWEVIVQQAGLHDWVRGLRLRANVGQHGAIMAGLREAQGDVIVTMDDDLQHSPSDIPALIEEILRGFDVVYANFRNRQHALWKRLGSQFNNFVATLLLNKDRNTYLSPFRAIRAEIRDEVIRYEGAFVYIDGLIISATSNIASAEVAHHSRSIGHSGYTLRKLLSLWLRMATNFSVVPLRIVSVLGISTAAVGFALALYLVYERLHGGITPPGWISVVVAILVMGGIQLVGMGVIGEYLGRVLLTLNGKPQYVVGERIGAPPSEARGGAGGA